MSKYRITAASLLVIILSSCSSPGPKTPSGKNYASSYDAYLAGDIELECFLSCAGAWGYDIENRKKLYATSNWEALAKSVLKIGKKGDLQYYYLGRAAEGMNKPDLALKYYTLANEVPPNMQCLTLGGYNSFGGKYDECDHLQFPKILLEATLRTKESLAKKSLKQ